MKDDFSGDDIDTAIDRAMLRARKDIECASVNKDCVVIHGVHQFSPMVLRAIEKLAESKKVILLFNYQPQYKNIYQTWIDIYSAFDSPISDSNVAEFRPSLSFSD